MRVWERGLHRPTRRPAERRELASGVRRGPPAASEFSDGVVVDTCNVYITVCTDRQQ